MTITYLDSLKRRCCFYRFIGSRILNDVGIDGGSGCILASKIVNPLVAYILDDRGVVVGGQGAGDIIQKASMQQVFYILIYGA